jgi:hypothetical protein
MNLKVWSLQENCGANLVPKSANLRRLSVKICVTMRENGKSSLRLYLWDSDGFQSSDPTGLSLLAQGSTKVAFGWKDGAHALGSRTEVRIGFAIASGDPNGSIPAKAGLWSHSCSE